MRFEWYNRESKENIKKHNISFDEAKEVFEDPLHIAILDERFNYFEERWITLGKTNKQKLLVVANLYFDDNDEEVVRIICAREATKHEQRQYETIGR